MWSSPFLHKRKLTGLFAAHDTPTRHAIPVQQTEPELRRIEKLYRLQPPKRPAAESPVSKVLCIPAQPQKAKVYSLLTRTADCFSIQQQSF